MGDQPHSDDTDRQAGYSKDELPYVLRRDNVMDERNSIMMPAQTETESLIREAIRVLEDEFGPNIYQSDVYEVIILNGLLDNEGELDEEGLINQAREFRLDLTT